MRHSTERDGLLVSLGAYRAARDAALFFRGVLHDPPWLADVKAEVLADGSARVVVILNWLTPLIERCLPTAVNHIPVGRYVKEE